MTSNRADWNVAIIDGNPEIVINGAALEQLIRQSPLSEDEARRRLRAAGYPVGDPEEPTH